MHSNKYRNQALAISKGNQHRPVLTCYKGARLSVIRPACKKSEFLTVVQLVWNARNARPGRLELGARSFSTVNSRDRCYFRVD
jgi:hypothetical protein